ncbi:MAG: hypothetical protein NVS3B17_04440 [Vulcanimicrobiaceae bacterium]
MNNANAGLKGLVMGQIDHGSTAAGEKVLASAASLRRVAVEMRGDDITRNAAGLTERGVEALERLGSYLVGSDGERLVVDAERLGRERPWAVATSGLVLGFVGSRMLKAAAARRDASETNFDAKSYKERS